MDGRTGVNARSTRARIALPGHTLNAPQGTLTMWVLALDDLAPSAQHPNHGKSNPHFAKHVLLTDREVVGDTDAAHFSLIYETYWHPVFYAKFAQGSHLENAWSSSRGAEALAGHFAFHRLHWYHVAVLWDRPASRFEIHANGVLVAAADATTPNLPTELCGSTLYIGSPALAVSEVSFFDRLLDAGELEARSGEDHDPSITRGLDRTFRGVGLPRLEWEPTDAWNPRLQLTLTNEEDYQRFFVQGCNNCITVDSDGLRIATPGMAEFHAPAHPVRPGVDMTRMYLWTRETFEGDLALSIDFRINAPGGLCLLMTQAAGMQGEDFLEDYPLRVNGSMGSVCWEDIRNYHWEFYRQSVDVPNVCVSHGCLKNPWFKPVAFQLENREWEMDRWYTLRWVQEGGHIRGAIDDVVVIDAQDDPFSNNGPILLNGRIAIRCMMRTDMTFRNLTVWNRPSFGTAPAALRDASENR